MSEIYLYKAKKNTAETVTGQISANSQEEAIELIHQLGLLPVSVYPQQADHASGSSGDARRVPFKEIYFFNRQLTNLLKAGVSLLKALHIIEEQSQNKHLKNLVSSIRMGVQSGRSFSECLADYPGLFSPLHITMVTAGEESNSLTEILARVSEHQLKQKQLFTKIKTALAYPVFMLGIGALSVYFILTFALPKMLKLFDSMGNTLPLPTILLLAVSRFFQSYGLWVLLGISLGVFGLLQWQKSSLGRAFLSRFFVRVPLFGRILLKTELARFASTLRLLLQSGISITSALRISVPVLNNESIKRSLNQCTEELIAGGSFGEALKKHPGIPSTMAYLISVGEETGCLEKVLSEIADSYEQEAEEDIKVMTTLIEPLMILCVGLVIGFIVFAMLLPIFEINVLSP